MAQNKKLFTKIVLTLGTNPSLIVEGDFDLADAKPLIDQFYGALNLGATAAQEAAMAARLKEERQKLEAAEQADAASHS